MLSPKINCLSLLLLLASCLGCTYTGAIRPDLAPATTVAVKSSQPAAVFFTPRLAHYQEVTKLTTHRAGTLTFPLGPALTEALTQSVQSVYQRVTILAAPPAPGEFPLVISFDLHEAQAQLAVIAIPFVSVTDQGNVLLQVTMEIVDRSAGVKKFSLQGAGFSQQRRQGGFSNRHFSPAFENAILQVADNAANLLAARVP